jgi:hypothetical protein
MQNDLGRDALRETGRPELLRLRPSPSTLGNLVDKSESAAIVEVALRVELVERWEA